MLCACRCRTIYNPFRECFLAKHDWLYSYRYWNARSREYFDEPKSSNLGGNSSFKPSRQFWRCSGYRNPNVVLPTTKYIEIFRIAGENVALCANDCWIVEIR